MQINFQIKNSNALGKWSAFFEHLFLVKESFIFLRHWTSNETYKRIFLNLCLSHSLGFYSELFRIYIYIYIYTNPSARVWCNTRSIFLVKESFIFLRHWTSNETYKRIFLNLCLSHSLGFYSFSYIYIYTNPSARVWCNTRSIFLSGL